MVVGFRLVSPLVPEQEPKRVPYGHGQSCGSWEWQKDVYSADNLEFIYITVKSEKNGQDHEILLLVLRDQQKPVLLVCRAQQTAKFGLNLSILKKKISDINEIHIKFHVLRTIFKLFLLFLLYQ